MGICSEDDLWELICVGHAGSMGPDTSIQGSYLKANGERDSATQNLVYRTRKYVPTIRHDIDLLEKLVKKYDAQKTR